MSFHHTIADLAFFFTASAVANSNLYPSELKELERLERILPVLIAERNELQLDPLRDNRHQIRRVQASIDLVGAEIANIQRAAKRR